MSRFFSFLEKFGYSCNRYVIIYLKGYIDLPVPGYFAPKALKAVIVAWTVTDGFPDGPGADPSKWNYVQTR